MESEPRPEAPPALGERPNTALLIGGGALLAFTVVGAPLAFGGLLHVIAATAAARPSEAGATGAPGQLYRRGLMGLLCSLAWLAPGPVLFGAAYLALTAGMVASDPQRAALAAAGLAASGAYLVIASVYGEAAFTEYAIRGKAGPALDVGVIWERVVSAKGFWHAWAISTAWLGGAFVASVGLGSFAGWPAWAVIPLVSAALFAAGVPAAFSMGAFARGAYGLLACVPTDEPGAGGSH